MTILSDIANEILSSIRSNLDSNEQNNSWNQRAPQERRDYVCDFNDDISYDDFESAVRKAAKKIKRIEHVNVSGPYVTCSVRSSSGISIWEFIADFNDYGHVTGTYWLFSENDDSNIPEFVADEMQELVSDKICEVRQRKEFERQQAAAEKAARERAEREARTKANASQGNETVIYSYQNSNEPGKFVFTCEHCGQSLSVPLRREILIATCNKCQAKYRIM